MKDILYYDSNKQQPSKQTQPPNSPPWRRRYWTDSCLSCHAMPLSHHNTLPTVLFYMNPLIVTSGCCVIQTVSFSCQGKSELMILLLLYIIIFLSHRCVAGVAGAWKEDPMPVFPLLSHENSKNLLAIQTAWNQHATMYEYCSAKNSLFVPPHRTSS
jgi:hypothetical protein